MLSSLILFIPIEWIRVFLYQRLGINFSKIQDDKKSYYISIPLKIVLLGFVAMQLLIPLRHHLFEGNVDYTGEGQRFSWRMKSVYKDFTISFRLIDEERGISANLDPRAVLTIKQYTNLGYYPELVIPVADNLREAASKKGVKNPKIYVDYKVGFMGLELQDMIDPKLELGSLKYSPFSHSEWILPLMGE